ARRHPAPGPEGSGAAALPAHHGPQGHRDPLPRHVVHVLPRGRGDGPADARGADGAGTAVPLGRAVQPARHDARHGDAAALRDADPVRLRQLHPAAADRRARRGVPAAQRVLLLAVPVRQPDGALQLPHPGRRRRLRLVRLRPAVRAALLPRRRCDAVVLRADRVRARHDPGRGQHGDDGRLPAGAGHDDVPDADLLLEHLRHLDPHPRRLPDPHRGAARAARRPPPGRARVRPRERRGDPVAAHVLVLRPPRGLHRGAAVLRHHHRDHPGVQPQAAVRLPADDLGDDRHHRAVGGGVGAPHVRHRRHPAGVLLVHDVPHRRADRDQVRQLDRHDVARQDHLRDADAVRGRLPGDVPVRWAHRRPARVPSAGLPPQRHLLRRRALPLRAVRHDRVLRLRRHLLLVPEDDGEVPRRDPREDPLLDDVRRVPPDVPGAPLAGPAGHAAPLRRLPAPGRLHGAELDLLGRRVPARDLHAAVPVERLPQLPVRPARHGGRPVGPRQLPGVGDDVAAPAPQLPRAAPDPLRAPGVRAALPAPRGALPGRGPRQPGHDRRARGPADQPRGRAGWGSQEPL
ncbi:MAG: Cytochrome c oxidase polypeptide I, partial [uncultured Pseudonocardia sp.]